MQNAAGRRPIESGATTTWFADHIAGRSSRIHFFLIGALFAGLLWSMVCPAAGGELAQKAVHVLKVGRSEPRKWIEGSGRLQAWGDAGIPAPETGPTEDLFLCVPFEGVRGSELLGGAVVIGIRELSGGHAAGTITGLRDAERIERGGELVIRVHNPTPHLLRPGMHATARVAIDDASRGVDVPVEAILHRDGDPIAFVVADERAWLRRVVLGERHERRIEVVEGLQPGEIIVVRGHGQLRDGDQVRRLSAPSD